MKLMYASLIRASQTSRGVMINEFEHKAITRQFGAVMSIDEYIKVFFHRTVDANFAFRRRWKRISRKRSPMKNVRSKL